jgi:hypothetical protein
MEFLCKSSSSIPKYDTQLPQIHRLFVQLEQLRYSSLYSSYRTLFLLRTNLRLYSTFSKIFAPQSPPTATAQINPQRQSKQDISSSSPHRRNEVTTYLHSNPLLSRSFSFSRSPQSRPSSKSFSRYLNLVLLSCIPFPSFTRVDNYYLFTTVSVISPHSSHSQLSNRSIGQSCPHDPSPHTLQRMHSI